MSKIEVVSYTEMEKASKDLQAVSDTYIEIYTQLMQKASTMGKAWDSADNQAFVQQISGFTEELKQMADKLSLASRTLKTQADNLKQRRDVNIADVKKLKN